jgi:hypothetical protein
MPTSSRSYWYNRNLVIIANIERQFLGPDDLKEIHYYFGKHRKKSAMITHLKIQYALGLGPGIHAPAGNSELSRSLPYLAATPWAIFLWFLRKNRIDSYQEFLDGSTGRSAGPGAGKPSRGAALTPVFPYTICVGLSEGRST